MSEKNEFNSLSWKIYDVFEYIENLLKNFILPLVIIPIVFLTAIWVLWPDFTDKRTLYSYSVTETNCPSERCERKFHEPVKYVINNYNQTVTYKDYDRLFVFRRCIILDKKNWSCDHPNKMIEGIFVVSPNVTMITDNFNIHINYLPKRKWKLKKIQNFLSPIFKH